jgi:hypothetical protein
VYRRSRRYMLYFMLPLWIVPGFLDYLSHRKTKIETTSGTQESIIHALMTTEAGIPVVMGLLLEINTGGPSNDVASLFRALGNGLLGRSLRK